jgi:glucoamylase
VRHWIVSRIVLVGTVLVVVGAFATSSASAAPSAARLAAQTAQLSVAPGSPGSESYFDLARKDCVGTAMNTTSKVWFTVADGVLSDTYWPTVDATNVNTLQYIVTDGHSFTDLSTRDMTYTITPDPTGMSCTIVASNSAHAYQITTTYIADPNRDAVLMHVAFNAPAGDQLYVRLDPLAGGTGGGGTENAGGNTAAVVDDNGESVPVVSNTNTTTDAVNRSYAVPTYMALESSNGFSDASVGYAGTASDGLTMLDTNRYLTPYDSAPDGHVTLTAQVPTAGSSSVNLALGFGSTQAQALTVAGASVAQYFPFVLAQYEAGWKRYDRTLKAPASSLGTAAINEYYESINVVRGSVDKTFPGAIAAGLASPWGQSVPAGNLTNGEPTYFGSYREVFSRDLYEAATALFLAGDTKTAQQADEFLFDKQELPSGAMPRNSLLNGEAAPDTGGLQLDETSYPILMDWEFGLASNATLYRKHVIPMADFLVAHGPSDGNERWEEQSGYSPSTIAAEIAGLTAAASIAQANNDPLRAAVYQATADDFARNIKAWTVTTDGPFISSTVPSYFIRISKDADPNSPDPVDLGNGSITVPQNELIDAGFLELVRLGILPASDPTVQSSLTVVDETIERMTPSGPGFYRYGTSSAESVDGYGDCFQPSGSTCSVLGAPWAPTDTGTGHLWPVLSGERGEYDVAAGDSSDATTLLTAMRNMTSGQGLEPEQVWEDPAVPASPFGTDPATASIGFEPGQPAGSASPLTWAQAQYARLALDISAGRELETPSIVTARYVSDGMPGSLPLTITSPSSGASVNSSTVSVTGTTTPGATVDAEGVGATGGKAATASATADSSGNWTLSLPTGFGSTTITVTATLGDSTGYSQVTVTNVALPGTTVLNVTDPTGDDNGPGTYQYPTSGDFTAGSFDLTGMKVSQTGTDVYIQASIKNLVPIFGNSFGGQLLDLYVRNPSATTTTTDAAYPQLNYSITPADAWSEHLEAQGFAPAIWDDASGTSLGSVDQVVDDPSGTITLIVPQSVFGTVGSGWVFTVTLTGQNGYNSYEARDFTATPGAYTFGVCAVGGTSPICSYPPSEVPYVVDTITPPGVSQDTELNPTLGPVVLTGVTVP